MSIYISPEIFIMTLSDEIRRVSVSITSAFNCGRDVQHSTSKRTFFDCLVYHSVFPCMHLWVKVGSKCDLRRVVLTFSRHSGRNPRSRVRGPKRRVTVRCPSGISGYDNGIQPQRDYEVSKDRRDILWICGCPRKEDPVTKRWYSKRRKYLKT